MGGWAYDATSEKFRKDEREEFMKKVNSTKKGIGTIGRRGQVHVAIDVEDRTSRSTGYALCTKSLYLNVIEGTMKDVTCKRCLKIAEDIGMMKNKEEC